MRGFRFGGEGHAMVAWLWTFVEQAEAGLARESAPRTAALALTLSAMYSPHTGRATTGPSLRRAST